MTLELLVELQPSSTHRCLPVYHAGSSSSCSMTSSNDDVDEDDEAQKIPQSLGLGCHCLKSPWAIEPFDTQGHCSRACLMAFSEVHIKYQGGISYHQHVALVGVLRWWTYLGPGFSKWYPEPPPASIKNENLRKNCVPRSFCVGWAPFENEIEASRAMYCIRWVGPNIELKWLEALHFDHVWVVYSANMEESQDQAVGGAAAWQAGSWSLG